MSKEKKSNKIYDRYEDFNSMNKKQLQLAVQTLSKTANQRLRSLEKAGMKKSSNAYKWAEKSAFDNLRFMDRTKNDEIKFKTTTRGRDVNELREEVAELRDFLFKSKTSTVSDVNKRYRQIYETWKKNNPDSDMTQDTFGEMWTMSNMKQLVQMYGSDIAISILTNRDEYKNLDMKDVNDFVEEFVNADNVIPYTDLIEKLTEESNRLENTDDEFLNVEDIKLFDLPF